MSQAHHAGYVLFKPQYLVLNQYYPTEVNKDLGQWDLQEKVNYQDKVQKLPCMASRVNTLDDWQ